MAELLEAYEPRIKRVSGIPSDGGRFEVTVNGELVYSKLRTGRHLEPGELVELVGSYLQRMDAADGPGLN